MPPPSPRLAPDTVQVWHVSTDDWRDDAAIARACESLRPDERRRYDRFRFARDRHMFLAGRLLARHLVGRAIGVAPDAWQWREGPHGRPEIASPATTVRFNLAHSANLVVCALSVGRDVGVDVEDLERAEASPELVHRYCAPEEIADIESRPAPVRHERFLHYWTLKEAYLKARGLGISVPLADICFTVDSNTARVRFLDSLAGADTRWAFHLARPTARHLIAVAASTEDGVTPDVHVGSVQAADLLGQMP